MAKLHLRRAHPTERWHYGPDTFVTAVSGKPAWWSEAHEAAYPGVVAGYQNNMGSWQDALLFTEEEVIFLRFDTEVIRARWSAFSHLGHVPRKVPFPNKSITLHRADGLQLELPTYATSSGAFALWSFFQGALLVHAPEEPDDLQATQPIDAERFRRQRAFLLRHDEAQVIASVLERSDIARDEGERVALDRLLSCIEETPEDVDDAELARAKERLLRDEKR